MWSSGFLSSGIYDGECFDANIVPERLCGVELTQAGYPIVPQSGPPVRVMGERKPILILSLIHISPSDRSALYTSRPPG